MSKTYCAIEQYPYWNEESYNTKPCSDIIIYQPFQTTLCDTECVICCNPFITHNEHIPDYFITECKHEFHYSCIKQWLKYKESCPLCRRHVPMIRDMNKITDDIDNNDYPYGLHYSERDLVITASAINFLLIMDGSTPLRYSP